MTERRTNRLTIAASSGSLIAGSDAALQQLQDHCDRLNAMNGGRDGWHVVGVAPNRTIAKQNERREAA